MLVNDIKECARKTIGIYKGTKKPHHVNDTQISKLVKGKKDLKSNRNSTSDFEQRRKIASDIKDVEILLKCRYCIHNVQKVSWVVLIAVC